ncbi:MAG: SDR family NAD(P)-dependent oxidoreductase [Nocardioidaceae bacterium]
MSIGGPARAGARLVDTALDRSVVGGYSRIGIAARRLLPGWPADPAPGALAGQHMAVTGATSGLGQRTCRDLAALGAVVHLMVRSPDKGERVREQLRGRLPDADLRLWRCDVSDLADVRRFADEFTSEVDRLDVLVHNAGVMPPRRTESAQGHELSMATHVLGPLLMTELLRPALSASGSSRVVLVTSGGMYAQRLPVSDPEYRQGPYRGASAYARSKRVQVALLPFLARRWAPHRITVCAMHPGWADTPGVASSLPCFQRATGPILRDVADGADTTVWLAATDPAPPSGLLWHDRRPRPEHLVPWTRETLSARESMGTWCILSAGVAGDRG